MKPLQKELREIESVFDRLICRAKFNEQRRQFSNTKTWLDKVRERRQNEN